MSKQIEALKLALAVLKSNDTWGSSIREAKEKAITAIKEALAQPEQAPVAHCEAGPEYCWKCNEEMKPTYGSEEIRKLREANKSLNNHISDAKKMIDAPAWWPAVENILNEYGLQAIDFVADFKNALAQQEQETVGYWKEHAQGMQRDYDSLLADYEKLTQQEQEPVKYSDYEPDGVHHNKPEQKPVAWRAPNWGHGDDEWVYRDFDDPVLIADGKPSPNNEALYTAPPPRPRVGLTWEDANEIAIAHDVRPSTVKAIEAKLKE